MKWSAFITEGAIQFNLEPENDHEKELLSSLAKYTGEVSVHKGVSIRECRGGYLRNYGGDERHTAITIKPPAARKE